MNCRFIFYIATGECNQLVIIETKSKTARVRDSRGERRGRADSKKYDDAVSIKESAVVSGGGQVAIKGSAAENVQFNAPASPSVNQSAPTSVAVSSGVAIKLAGGDPTRTSYNPQGVSLVEARRNQVSRQLAYDTAPRRESVDRNILIEQRGNQKQNDNRRNGDLNRSTDFSLSMGGEQVRPETEGFEKRIEASEIRQARFFNDPDVQRVGQVGEEVATIAERSPLLPDFKGLASLFGKEDTGARLDKALYKGAVSAPLMGASFVVVGEKIAATGEGLFTNPDDTLRELGRGFKLVEEKEFSFLPGGTPINVEGGTTLITAGLGALSVSPSRTISREPVSQATQSELRTFVKQEGIADSILTKEQVSKMNEIVVQGERRVGKAKMFTPETTEVSTELALRPVEGVDIVGQTKNRGVLQLENRYAILRKGEPELVKPSEINQFDYLELKGSQSLTNQNPFQVKGPEIKFKQITDQSGIKALPGGNLGSLSTESKAPFSVTRPVREFISADKFNEYVGLRGARVEADSFVKNIDRLDFDRATVFRSRSVKTGGDFGTGDVFERTSFDIQGFQGKTPKDNAGFGFDKITRQYKKPTTREALEDLRFRLEYQDKKLLTAKNIREVTEFETGYYVKLYTFDDTARAFKNVEAFIPKKTGPIIGTAVAAGTSGKVTTASDIIGRQPQTTGIVSDSPTGSVVLQMDKPEVKVETSSLTKLADTIKEETKKKKKIEREPSTDYSSFSSPSGGDYFINDLQSAPTRPIKIFDVTDFNSLRRASKGEVGGVVIPSFSVGSRSRNEQRNNQLSGVLPKVDTGISSSNLPKVDSLTGQKPMTGLKTGQMQSPKLDTLNKFDFARPTFRNNPRNTSEKPNRMKPPKMDLDFNFGKRASFSVEGRRYGKFDALAKNVTFEEANKIGENFAKTTLGASFRIKERGNLVAPNVNLSKFYVKNNVAIEKAPFRLSSLGERKEIKIARLRGGLL